MTIREQIREMIEPRKDSASSQIYDWVMLAAIVIGILPLVFRGQPTIFWYFDLISGLCFMADYFLRWITTDLTSRRSRIVAFLIYPFTPMAIIDLLSILPIFNLVSPTFKVVRVSRLLKILRVIKVVRYYEPLEIILAVVRRIRIKILAQFDHFSSHCRGDTGGKHVVRAVIAGHHSLYRFHGCLQVA